MSQTPQTKTIYALGLFDGVHLGHQALLTACRELAQAHACQAGVVTFTSHPDALVLGSAPALINTQGDRKALLQLYGICNIVELPFDKALMTTHWSAFLTQLVEYDAAGFVCGSDFRFGAGGSGTSKKVEAFCNSRSLPCQIVPQQYLDGVRISSTHIRSLLENGQVEQANRFLGHPHVLTGCVAPGQKLGRTMGTPTANLSVPAGQLCLKHGVYACKAFVEGQVYLAVTNVGMRPTVAGDHVTVESWLLDFEGDLYGKTLTLEFHKFLRPEVKFDSLEGLKEQIQTDAQQTRQLLTGEPQKV